MMLFGIRVLKEVVNLKCGPFSNVKSVLRRNRVGRQTVGGAMTKNPSQGTLSLQL